MNFFIGQNRFSFVGAEGQKNDRHEVGFFNGRMTGGVFAGRVFVLWRDNVLVARGLDGNDILYTGGQRGRCPSSRVYEL